MRSILSTLTTIVLFFAAFTAAAQHHHAKSRHPRAGHHQVVHRSPHRPAVAVVYHPHWAPHHELHRRWIYFPKHRFYWDNWRNVYFYHNGTAWVSCPGFSPHLNHLKLENEKFKELKEEDDDNDEIYLR